MISSFVNFCLFSDCLPLISDFTSFFVLVDPNIQTSHGRLTPPNMTTPAKPSNEVIHKLYHEAQKRANQPQPVIRHGTFKSLLLAAPNSIIFELFNTIVKEVSADKLMDFITANLKSYLNANWTNKVTKQAINRLKREQTIDVRAGLVNAPMIKFSTGVLTARPATTVVDIKQQRQQQQQHQMAIQSPLLPSPPSPPTTDKGQQDTGNTQQAASKVVASSSPPQSQAPAPSDVIIDKQQSPGAPSKSPTKQQSKVTRSSSLPGVSGANNQKSPTMDYKTAASKQKAIDQIYEHVMWRIKTDNVTQITSLLIKLVLDDGYKKGALKVESYDEILECFQDWRSQKLIKLYSFGTAPANDQKLVLASTTSGDLTKWIANYIDGSEKRQKPDLIRVLATALRDKTKNCIYITNELTDALRSLETGALRCVFLVDRLHKYEPIQSMPKFTSAVEPLITSGKLYLMSSLKCVEFAPDPSNDACC
jgi:hypothetical protein